MDWSARFSWLAMLRARRTPRPALSDPADMGTAFGLDASFDAADACAPASGHTRPPAAAAAWEDRLVRRSGL